MLIGVILGLAASASWAAANVFVQRSSRAVGPFRALAWAQLTAGAALVPLALVLDDRSGSIDAGVIVWSLVAGVSALLAYGCLFVSTGRGKLSIVVPIMSSWSVIAAGLSITVLGQVVRRTHLVGAALVVTGVLIVSRFSQARDDGDAPRTDAEPSPGAQGSRNRGALPTAIGTAVGFGVLIPAMDRLSPIAGRLGVIPLVFLLDLLLGLPLALAARIDVRPPPRAAWVAVLAAGLFETAGFVWISLGIARAPVAIVAPLAGLSSAFTVIYAWLVLRERPPATVLLGAAIACAGVVTLAL